ncbi:MAG TPA: GNAT family N-acetyltransferase [Caulobacteraceae bacterium]|jgi:predicted acetyltransferase|nr:GNAT family N-acetyltransferase [Caulobacteraceae bacterium]
MPLAAEDVEIAPATQAERPLIAGMLQFYFYDFSEMEPRGSDSMELEASGQFGAYLDLADYWRDPSRAPLIIRRRGRPAGFALLDASSHSGRTVDRNMAEFFVMRKHRRGGVAATAVREILARHPGRWEIAVAARNTGALAFWPRAIAATPGLRDLTTLEGDGVRWTGPIHAFTVAG